MNRLAAINEDSSGSPGSALASYTFLGRNTVVIQDYEQPDVKLVYDARNQRITKDVSSVVRHFYYSSQWQSLEERLDSSTSSERQHIWGPFYVDQLLLRERDTTDPANGTLDQRLYALQDANWNVTAMIDTGGTVQERYTYEPYGTPLFWDSSWGTRSSSTIDNPYTFTGRRLDNETGFLYYRERYYITPLAIFGSRDSLRYEGGYQLYEYVSGQPVNALDPTGELIFTRPLDQPLPMPLPFPFPPSRETFCQIPPKKKLRCVSVPGKNGFIPTPPGGAKKWPKALVKVCLHLVVPCNKLKNASGEGCSNGCNLCFESAGAKPSAGSKQAFEACILGCMSV